MNNIEQIIEMIDIFYALKRMYQRFKKQEHSYDDLSEEMRNG